MTPEAVSDRALRGRLAANVRWSRTPDRRAATAKARQALADKWEKQVDPDGQLDPALRAKLAENAKAAHYTKMALASAKSRRRKAS